MNPSLHSTALRALPIAAVLLFSLVAGALSATSPALSLGIGLSCLALIAVTFPRLSIGVSECSLAFLVLGYAFLGRGFAYFGVPPLYIGELALAIGVFSVFLAKRRLTVSLLPSLLVLFFVLGLARTLPFIGTFGLDAFRDAALWYYGIFALITYYLITPTKLDQFCSLYAFLILPLLIWFAVTSSFGRVFAGVVPNAPGTDVAILQLKQGDRAVVLAGIAAFILLGLYADRRRFALLPQWSVWIVWLAAFAFVAIGNRGGFIAVVVALAITIVLFPNREWGKLSVAGITVGLAILVIDPSIDVGGSRIVSVPQLVSNIKSIFGQNEEASSLQGTREWRLSWWTQIYDYTVHGQYFWQGKGFGVNLANEDGFQVREDESLRSPHNAHFNILARMGVPGVLLWLALQSTFAFQMVRSILLSKRSGRLDAAKIKTWLLVIWLASSVNASFDVYLEGPQGAIPFWCVFGAGMAMMAFDNESTSVGKFAMRSAELGGRERMVVRKPST